mgnify:CR=1 FL=1
MKWEKLGQIFAPAQKYPWMVSHAANPFVEHQSGDRFRIYFTCRDAHNRSSIAWADADLGQRKILDVAEEPLLTPGEPGAFDDSGTALAWIASIGGEKVFYYLGWDLSITVPWRNSIGLAVLDPHTGKLVRHSRAPILDRHDCDPFSISYPCVLPNGNGFEAWYGSNLQWGAKPETMNHVIKYATSSDGILWERHGEIAISLIGSEYALSKPCVIRDPDLYRMWYSHRGESYRLGYAESHDGRSWTRKDAEVGVAPSPSGWDSEMICYAHVFDHGGERMMVYNGNGYGLTGFGLARLVK